MWLGLMTGSFFYWNTMFMAYLAVTAPAHLQNRLGCCLAGANKSFLCLIIMNIQKLSYVLYFCFTIMIQKPLFKASWEKALCISLHIRLMNISITFSLAIPWWIPYPRFVHGWQNKRQLKYATLGKWLKKDTIRNQYNDWIIRKGHKLNFTMLHEKILNPKV